MSKLGKDSNVMVWLAFKAFLGKIPFPWFMWIQKNLEKCMISEMSMKKSGN